MGVIRTGGSIRVADFRDWVSIDPTSNEGNMGGEPRSMKEAGTTEVLVIGFVCGLHRFDSEIKAVYPSLDIPDAGGGVLLGFMELPRRCSVNSELWVVGNHKGVETYRDLANMLTS